jgi:hypothetical protein
MEDNTGVILLDHPTVNTDHLVSEDYPAAGEDIMNPFRETLNSIVLDSQDVDTLGLDFLQYEEDTGATGTARVTLESSNLPEEGYGVGYTPNQFWTVLPAYQYTRILTRLQGLITFADEGTTGTGADTLFTTQLRVGDEFQTADENIIAEDSSGGITLETDERIQHEDVTISDIQNVVLTTEVLELPIEEFRWMLTSEDAVLGPHITHPGVTGTYSDWNTGYYFVTHESNVDKRVEQEDASSIIEWEIQEWENNNMLWETGQKQLITDPQAFIVGAIANTTSLTVTRKHLGGVSDSVYQM